MVSFRLLFKILWTIFLLWIYTIVFDTDRICRGRDCMVVEFTTTHAISAYHH